jgi:hypothetical protein
VPPIIPPAIEAEEPSPIHVETTVAEQQLAADSASFVEPEPTPEVLP